jgi:hypothetical protein
MKPEVMLELLESAADQLGIRVSYEPLQSTVGNGGLCKVKGEYRIIIDKRATSEERIAMIASALNKSGGALDELELPAKVREVLRLHEGPTKARRTAA